MSPAEIADAIGERRSNVKQLLFKMAKADVVKIPGKRGLYVHLERTDRSTHVPR
jgi:hypothetical protein